MTAVARDRFQSVLGADARRGAPAPLMGRDVPAAHARVDGLVDEAGQGRWHPEYDSMVALFELLRDGVSTAPGLPARRLLDELRDVFCANALADYETTAKAMLADLFVDERTRKLAYLAELTPEELAALRAPLPADAVPDLADLASRYNRSPVRSAAGWARADAAQQVRVPFPARFAALLAPRIPIAGDGNVIAGMVRMDLHAGAWLEGRLDNLDRQAGRRRGDTTLDRLLAGLDLQPAVAAACASLRDPQLDWPVEPGGPLNPCQFMNRLAVHTLRALRANLAESAGRHNPGATARA